MRSIQSPGNLYASSLRCRVNQRRILITTRRPVFRVTALLFLGAAIWMTFLVNPELRDDTIYRVSLIVTWLATTVFSICFALPHDRLILDKLLRQITVESGLALLYMRKRVVSPEHIASVTVQEGHYLTDEPKPVSLPELVGGYALDLIAGIRSSLLAHTLRHEAVYAIRIHCRSGADFVTHQCWSREYVAEAVRAVDHVILEFRKRSSSAPSHKSTG